MGGAVYAKQKLAFLAMFGTLPSGTVLNFIVSMCHNIALTNLVGRINCIISATWYGPQAAQSSF